MLHYHFVKRCKTLTTKFATELKDYLDYKNHSKF